MSDHNMQYNSEKDHLIIPEYGRNVQMLIEHAKNIEEKPHRQAFIERVINLMMQMNPQNRNLDDHKVRMWQHVYRIAKYDIDLDPPGGIVPSPEDEFKVPEKVLYPHSKARYRHYGNNVQILVKKAIEMEEGPMRDGFVSVIGSYMKLAYRTWNKDHYISDEIIKGDLEKLSEGKLVLSESASLDGLSNANRRRKKPSGPSNNNSHQSRSNHRGGGRSNNNHRRRNSR